MSVLRNIVLAAALVGSLTLNFLLRPVPGRRIESPLANMANSPATRAYSPSDQFADGKILREPPAGSLPYGAAPLHYRPGAAEAERAGRELRQPYTAEPAALARGQQVFATYCAPCHGDGSGMGPVAQRGFPPPPSLWAPNALKLSDGRMFHIITRGQGNMPAHAAQIPIADRWKAVLHVRALQAAKGGQP